MNNSLLDKGIKDARKLIEDLNNSTEQLQTSNEEIPFQLISRIDLGTLILTREEVAQQNQTAITLHNAVKGKERETWSLKAINKLLQDAILQSLDIPKKSSQSFNQRLETALQKLKSSLSEPLKAWEFYNVVLGLDVSNEKRKIGNIYFFHADEANLEKISERINDIADESPNTSEEKENFKRFCKKQLFQFYTNTAVAFLKVYAGDLEAARFLALEELQTTLDVINFYTLSIHNDDLRVRVFLPGDAIGTQTLNLAFKENESFNFEFPSTGPLINFSLSSLDEQRSEKLGFNRLNQILANPTQNEIEKRLLAGVRIAGRAVSSIRREDAFLLHAIALESVLVGGNENTDLTYRLSTRCAHLLGKDLESRKAIKKEIAVLYGVRSAIVHRGDTNFTEIDLLKIRYYTRNILVTLLTKEDFKDFTKKEQLNQWFDERMLS
ncbi:MAG: HEPN domain-containing protein [Acidobacteriota bacterium]|nr:HEPN domain-containing protein [Acidobacteriota bacterium]